MSKNLNHLWIMAASMYVGICGNIENTTAQSVSSLFGSLRWQNRLLLIFYRNTGEQGYEGGNSQLAEQMEIIRRCDVGVRDRALWIKAYENSGQPAGEVKNYFGIRGEGNRNANFQIYLIGKDGGVKRSMRSVADLKSDIFPIIDVMPMRRREMIWQNSASKTHCTN